MATGTVKWFNSNKGVNGGVKTSHVAAQKSATLRCANPGTKWGHEPTGYWAGGSGQACALARVLPT